MKPVVYIDLDGVLARGNLPALFEICNRAMALGISAEQLARITSKKEFHELPETQVYQERIGKEQYLSQMKRLAWHPDYIRKLNVIDGAAAGVAWLARNRNVSYATARLISFHSGWNDQMSRATHIWLARNGFPEHDRVLFCDAYQGKLETIANQLQAEPHDVWLIDDSIPALLEAFGTLSGAEQALLQQHCTLIAFGCEDRPVAAPMDIIPLSGWNHIREIEKEFEHDKVSGRGA